MVSMIKVSGGCFTMKYMIKWSPFMLVAFISKQMGARADQRRIEDPIRVFSESTQKAQPPAYIQLILFCQ